MNYQDLMQKHRNELDSIPMAYAFSKSQLNVALDALDAKLNEVVSFGFGGIVKKTDQKALAGLFKRHEHEKNENMKEYEFALSAFIYELDNHEYVYSQEVGDTLSSLNLSLDDIDKSPILKKALNDAIIHVKATAWLNSCD
ncbi:MULTISPECIES: DUF7659 family protein [Cysteiniphilum]|uniref:Uncharacterized protein n=1 Tax=Cysteiniphilum litorale TaxID=2056700 RepID=A0A8J2Z3I8_9GAMM|nr:MULTISPECIES: hypothetical protein [Cysteiniphilum]GGF91463.1 hypothetical protein GCM10010995_05870 [Cysteiniphilum litorale]